MTPVSTLLITCGLPGTGKTTFARRLEREWSALRLTADAWLHDFCPGWPNAMRLCRQGHSASRRNDSSTRSDGSSGRRRRNWRSSTLCRLFRSVILPVVMVDSEPR
ncbi:AAA family ATPase [Streptomyces gilvosporeus]|uniref:AAA family ATPase n=1 Tax=Streptomyces gilvosporeus TaxID=553510 RepID=UPI000D1AAC91|nr:AAA family ATPase [Streptomyces gilvosporeus]